MDHSKKGMSHGQMDHGQVPPAKNSAASTKIDVNKDGKISKAEMAKRPKAAHFAMLDTKWSRAAKRQHWTRTSYL